MELENKSRDQVVEPHATSINIINNLNNIINNRSNII